MSDDPTTPALIAWLEQLELTERKVAMLYSEGGERRGEVEADAAMLRAAADALRSLHAALEKINTIRSSIVGLQALNWSEHVYPLVAALDEAGYVGMSYPEAQPYFGTMLERTLAAEAEVARLTPDVYPAVLDALDKHCRGFVFKPITRENIGALVDAICATHEREVQQRQAAESAVARLTQARDTLRTALQYVESVYRLNCVAEGEPSSVLEELQRVIKLTAGAEAGPLPAWQPIESCPKDGTWFLAWDEDCGFYTYRDGPGFLTGSDPSPTHWMPLPAGPLPPAKEIPE